MKPTQTVTDTPTDQVPRFVSGSIFVRDFAESDDGEVEYAGLWTFEAAGRRWVTDRYVILDAAVVGVLAGVVVEEVSATNAQTRLVQALLGAAETGDVTGVFAPHYLGELALAGVGVSGTVTVYGSLGRPHVVGVLRRADQVVGGLMSVHGAGLRTASASLVAAESRLRSQCPWLTARGRWVAAASSLDLLVPVDGWS